MTEYETAQEWCSEISITIEELSRSPELPFDFVPIDIEAKFPDIFRAAHSRVQACPLKLGGSANLNLLYSLSRGIKAQCIVETGVAYGWSSLAFLLATEDMNGARVYSIDSPYLLLQNDEWIGIAVPESLRSHWQIYRAVDRVGLPKALRQAGPVDLAHYDSDKRARGRVFGYRAMWRHLRPEGILISDDIGDNLAFRRFAEEVGRTPLVVAQNDKHQGLLIR